MPLIKIHSTEQPSGDGATTLLKACSQALAEHLKKPERYVMTCLMPAAPMTFAGTTDSTAFVEVKNIGTMSAEQTAAMSETVCGVLGDHLGIAADRIYIEFNDAERHLWGWDGKTFA